MAEQPLADLVARCRAGDQRAACELFEKYGEAVRIAARARLLHPALRRHFDSQDVVQSVFREFFQGAAAGTLTAEDERQLGALLAQMAQRKVAHRVRHLTRQRRDVRRNLPEGDRLVRTMTRDAELPDANVEAWRSFRGTLDDLTAATLDAREAGEPWQAIAARLGHGAEALRKRVERAVDEFRTTAARDGHDG